MARKRFAVLFSVALLTVLPSVVQAASEGHAPYLISSTIWAIISFVIVLAILLKVAFPAILRALDERATEIREGLEAADKARAEAAEMMAQHQDAMAKARAEAAGIVEEGKADAVRVKDGILADARREAGDITNRSRREIDQAKHDALETLKRQAASLSIDIAGKLIEKSLNADDHKALIDERLQRFEKLQEN